jgi:hypothetical protein
LRANRRGAFDYGMTPGQRSLYGRIGAAVARSRHSPTELTAKARHTFLQRFERQVRAEYPDLPESEILRRAGELRRAHFLRLAALSAASRGKKKAAAVPAATAQEVNDAPVASHPPRRA